LRGSERGDGGAAVDDDGLAGDEARGVGAEEDGGAGDLVRAPPAPQRRALGETLAERGIFGDVGVGFAPVRKPGKLPSAVHSASYELEYGSDTLELHQDAFPEGSRVLVIDDLIATGGTAAATYDLVEQSGSTVVGFGFVIELLALDGRRKLPDVPITTLMQY